MDAFQVAFSCDVPDNNRPLVFGELEEVGR